MIISEWFFNDVLQHLFMAKYSSILHLFIGKMMMNQWNLERSEFSPWQSWHDAQDQQRNGELEASVFRAGEKKNGAVASGDFLKDYDGYWVNS